MKWMDFYYNFSVSAYYVSFRFIRQTTCLADILHVFREQMITALCLDNTKPPGITRSPVVCVFYITFFI